MTFFTFVIIVSVFSPNLPVATTELCCIITMNNGLRASLKCRQHMFLWTWGLIIQVGPQRNLVFEIFLKI